MKTFLHFVLFSALFADLFVVYAQNKIEDQIENNKAFEYNVMREAVTLFPSNNEKLVKNGVLEIKKPRELIIIDRNKQKNETDEFVSAPIINKLGAYSSFFLSTSLSGGYDEAWESNSNLDRKMSLISSTSNVGFGMKIGNKFGVSRAEFEVVYDNASFKSKQTPYQRKLYGPALGFNLIADIGDSIVRPYIGVGVGYAKLNTKRTGVQTLLFGEAKDKANSHYVKPIVGLSFNIPGGNIFAEMSYKLYNNAKFTGTYCTSPVNCYENNVNYDNFGLYNLITGVTFYF